MSDYPELDYKYSMSTLMLILDFRNNFNNNFNYLFRDFSFSNFSFQFLKFKFIGDYFHGVPTCAPIGIYNEVFDETN